MYYTDFSVIPDAHYSIVYADPPWVYRDKALAGNRGAGCKYPLMSYDELSRMDIHRIAQKDAVLFMWTTFPQLSVALKLIDAWKFTYKTSAFTWVKHTKNGKLHWGMGRWTRSNPEVCLLATKGHPHPISHSVHSVLTSPISAHSRKPDEARSRIVTLCGDLPRIELFARGRIDGWDAWGNEPSYE
jgi:N6-adenosine-specific RNA methylase IME4